MESMYLMKPQLHRMTNKDWRWLTGDCPTHGPKVKMLSNGKCALYKEEKRKARADGTYVPEVRRTGEPVHTYPFKGGRLAIPASEVRRMKEGKSCEICGGVEKLHIDHCHETGKIRGILCNLHNVMLGYAQDDIDILAKAIEYLKTKG